MHPLYDYLSFQNIPSQLQLPARMAKLWPRYAARAALVN